MMPITMIGAIYLLQPYLNKLNQSLLDLFTQFCFANKT